MIYLKIAWRNIWRNKRRTGITVGSVFFAVLLAVVMFAILQGVYGNMVRNMAGFTTGFVQVHQKGYWDDKVLDNAMTLEDDLLNILESTGDITHTMPRIESFALMSTGDKSSPAMLMGIDPSREDAVNNLSGRLVEGDYFTVDDAAALVGEGLAGKLGLHAGDTILMLGQGYHAASAYGKYVIKGVVEVGNPDLSKSLVYLPLNEMQNMLSMPGMVTSVAMMAKPGADLSEVTRSLQSVIDTSAYNVMDWTEMMPELVQTMEGDEAGNKIMIYILYMVIGFGLFSTVLMMLTERQHEFGIMTAIGTGRRQLAFIVFIEVMIIALIGIALGILGGLPILQYLDANPIQLKGELAEIYESYGFEPIMPVMIHPDVFLSQAKIVFVIALLVSIYPIVKLMRFSVMKALRS
jgi:putative ABC transport system permease protein